MEIGGLFTALLFGAIIGGLGRLVIPGRQHLSWLATILVGIGFALLGGLLAGLIGGWRAARLAPVVALRNLG